jgi:hypothetical protein
MRTMEALAPSMRFLSSSREALPDHILPLPPLCDDDLTVLVSRQRKILI